MKKLILLLLAGALATLWGAPVTQSFTFDTSSLTGTGSVFFSLGGFGTAEAATAEISDFEPNALGAVLFDANTTGSLPAGLVLSFPGSGLFAYHEREVTFSSELSFDVTLAGTPGAGEPVSFVMILYDQFGAEVMQGTPGPPLLSVDYDAGTDGWIATLNTPEPSSLILAAAGGIAMFMRRLQLRARR